MLRGFDGMNPELGLVDPPISDQLGSVSGVVGSLELVVQKVISAGESRRRVPCWALGVFGRNSAS